MYTRMNKIMLATLVVGFATVTIAKTKTEDVKTQTRARIYSYDSNKDGYIQPEEFSTYFYTKCDMDGDGFIGDKEWKMSTSHFYRHHKDLDHNDLTYWDQDKNKLLDNSEIHTLIKDTGLYSKWDVNTDGKISSAEFEVGTFNSYDDNGDGKLIIEEWKTVLK